jgi:hypothetical protein
MTIWKWKRKLRLNLKRRENLQNDYDYSILCSSLSNLMIIRKDDIDIVLM